MSELCSAPWGYCVSIQGVEYFRQPYLQCIKPLIHVKEDSYTIEPGVIPSAQDFADFVLCEESVEMFCVISSIQS
jgi:hypothetical protein